MDGITTVMKLFDYGIHNEKSDIRAHVCTMAGGVYVFQTKVIHDLIKNRKFPERKAYQQGILTAIGYVIPATEIPDIRFVKTFCDIKHDDDLGSKGKKAVDVVIKLLETGNFPLWINKQTENNDLKIQINGTDITLNSKVNIQVKCDFKGGVGEGCTGNLFIQLKERNPFGIH